MAVMTRMRENTKTILIILVFAFMATIVFSWGMGGLKCGPGVQLQQGIIAEVNGNKISREDFDSAFEDQLAAYRQNTGMDLEDYQVDQVRNSIWDALIENELVGDELDKMGFEATSEEIRYYILEQPPEFIRQQDLFKNEQGFFDINQYQNALNDQRLSSYWLDIERLMYLYLPRQKLEHAIQACAFVTDEEMKREYLRQNQRAKVNYIVFEAQPRGTSFEISDEELQNYYTEHKDEFKEPEKRKIDYVLFSSAATFADTLEIQRLTNELYQRALDGEDFAELAEIYSEDPGSAENGGDLGFFDRETMLKPFSDAAFGARIGEIVGPVETIHGLHIIKVEDRKVEDGETQVKARHILLKYGPLQTTIENANYAATYFVERLRDGEDFYETAASESLTVESTDFFQAGGFVPTIGVNAQASRFIFSANIGTTSGAINITNGYIVFRVSDIQKERFHPLEEVKTQIQGTLTTEKIKNLSKEKSERAYQKILGGTPLYQVAEDDSLEVKESDYFTRNGYLPGIGRDARFIGTAFGLEVGEVSSPFEGANGYYVVQLLEKDEFNEADFDNQRMVVKNQILQRRKDSIFREWLAGLKEEAKIEDYRGFFGY